MIIRFLLSAIAATASFILLKTLITGFLSFLVALLVYFLTYRFIRYITKKKDIDKSSNGKNNKDHEIIINQSFEKLRQIRNSTIEIQNNEAADKIRNICKTGFEILEYLKKNPEDMKKGARFLNYYLETTEKIVNRYKELSLKKEKSPDIEKAMHDVESILDSIYETYKKQLNYLLEDDLLDLSVEIKVLEKTMKLES
jgi:5-bromo-4-chloroindolyl phosphate hydrolysis protein